MAELDFFSNYVMMAITKEIPEQTTFFRDRYFPTGAGDIFNADEVLTEYQRAGRKMACFVAPRVGDIPVLRDGYSIHAYKPAFIAPSRVLTIDDLNKRGFGEAMYPGLTPAERAARLQLDDQTDLDRRIVRREEWMAVQTMINNGCIMQEYIDANTTGDELSVLFYDGTSDHTFIVSSSNYWNGANAHIREDVRAMCTMLSKRGLPVADLVLGTAAADALYHDAEFRAEIDLNSNLNAGAINETIQYPGVTFMGRINFGGFVLNVFAVNESYEADDGTDTPYFPETSAMVTAPGCGHMMYGAITQMDYGTSEFATHAAKRVPKLIVDQEKDIRKIRLGSRPLAAPKNYCPYIYAANVVSSD